MPPQSLSSTAQRSDGLAKVLRNVGVLLTGKAINAPLSLVHISLAIHLLGSFDFGLIAMMYAFARMMGDVVDFQSWQVILHYGLRPLTQQNRHGFQRIIGFSLFLDTVSGLLGCGLGVAIALLGMNALGWPPQIHGIGAVYCISILFMTTATPTGLLRVFDRFDLLAMQGTTATVVRVIGTSILFFTGASVTALAIVWMLAEAAAWTLLFGFAYRELHRRDLLRGFIGNFRHTIRDILTGAFGRQHPGIWHFAWSTNFSSTLALTFGHVGTLMVGALLGPADAGYYRIASQIAAGIAKPVTLVQTTLYPEMARMWREKATKKLYRMAAQVALAGGLVGTLLLLAAFFASNPLITLITGNAHTHAVPVMLWLLAAEIVSVWGLPLEPILFTTHKSGAATFARVLETVFFLPLLFVMIRWYGLNGVGPATLCAVTVLIAIQLVMVLTSRTQPVSGRESAA